MWIFIIAIAILCICYYKFVNKLKGLPPGPTPLPVFGNVLSFDMDMQDILLKWKKKYGSVYTLWMPKPTVIIADHKILQETIIKDGDKYGDRSVPEEMMKLLVGGNYGLGFNDNQIWKEQRRFALHSLRDVGFKSSMLQDTAIDYSQDIISRWVKEGANGNPIDLTNGFIAGVANLIWQLTFGRTLSYDDPLIMEIKDLTAKTILELTHPLVLIMEIIPAVKYIDFLFGYPIKSLKQSNDRILEILNMELVICEEQFNVDNTPKCYAESFLCEMAKRKANGESGGSFTRHQLIVACYDLLTAGFETTVTTLRFAIHYLINNPNVQKKIQEEIDKNIGKKTIRMEDQKSLPYCCAVIQETQRCANIIPMNFFRKTSQSTNIAVHIDENEFERPEYFCPERHIDDEGHFIKDDRITPFSIGKRSCLGEGLARMELFIFLTSFVQNLTFSSVSKIPPELKVVVGMARSPIPYQVIVKPRS